MIIAVDGPSGAGKSSACKLVSKKTGFEYLDTGAMYRACAYKLYLLKAEVNSDNAKKYIENINIDYIDNQIYLDGKNIEGEIRTPEISLMASEISKLALVRELMVNLQRKIAQSKNVIVDGRDIGTVVFPEASLKIFITASPEIRGKRRFNELIEKGEHVKLRDIIEDIKLRDENDMNRKISPLKIADDAILMDTSHQTLNEVVDEMILLIENRKQE